MGIITCLNEAKRGSASLASVIIPRLVGTANLEAHLTGNIALKAGKMWPFSFSGRTCVYTTARAAPSALRVLSAASGKIPATEPPTPESWPKLETNLNHSTGTD